MKFNTQRWANREFLRKLITFGFVGTMTALIYVVLIQLFRSVFDFSLLWSGTLAYPLAIVINYIGQGALTFRVRLRDRAQFARFIVSNVVCYTTSMAMMSVLPGRYGMEDNVALMLVVIVLPVVNFALYLFWVFKGKAESAANRAFEKPELQEHRDRDEA